jgi:very-short-patch-repair endonuclease
MRAGRRVGDEGLKTVIISRIQGDPMKKRLRSFPAAIQNARSLRRSATIPERVLWNALRHRKLGGWKFRRQHPVGPFVLDFFCREKSIAIELDGDIHSQKETAIYDLERTRYFKRLGVRILRFPNDQVLGNLPGVLSKITKAMENHK